MQTTPNLGLKKPDLNDYVSVADLNENADILDVAVSELQDGSAIIPDLETANKTLAGGINEVKSGLTTHLAERASLTEVGHVQLNSSVTSTSEALAATPKAVKTAMDRADAAFQSANDGKTAVSSAVSAKGVAASPSDTFPVLATKIGQISTGYSLPSLTSSNIDILSPNADNYLSDTAVVGGEIIKFVANFASKTLTKQIYSLAGTLLSTSAAVSVPSLPYLVRIVKDEVLVGQGGMATVFNFALTITRSITVASNETVTGYAKHVPTFFCVKDSAVVIKNTGGSIVHQFNTQFFRTHRWNQLNKNVWFEFDIRNSSGTPYAEFYVIYRSDSGVWGSFIRSGQNRLDYLGQILSMARGDFI